MRTIAIINQKGGCGKTTSAINLAAVFAKRKFRTLLIDLDPQSHCAAGLGVPDKRIERDIGDALTAPADKPVEPTRLVWRVARDLDLVPSRMKLAGVESARGGLADRADKEKRLAGVIERLHGNKPGEKGSYDVCIIDCPPSIGLLTYNALVACTEVLIPVETSFFSLRGATRQINTIRSLSRRFGVRPKVRLLATLHDGSEALAKDLLRELRERFKKAVIPTVIRLDPALKSAASFGQPVVDFAPLSAGAEDYTAVGAWLAEHAKITREELEEALEPRSGDETIGRREYAGQTGGLTPSVLGDLPPRRGASVLDVKPGLPERPTPLKPMSRLEELAKRARAMTLGAGPSRRPLATPVPKPALAPTPTQQPEPGNPLVATAVAPGRPMSTVQVLPSGGALAVVPLTRKLAKPVVLELVTDEEETKPAEVLDSVKRLFGVRKTSRGALFVQPMTLGERVCVAGSFNGWQPEQHPMRANPALGVHEVQIELPPGVFEYRIVADGRWVNDPYNDKTVGNTLGEQNNVVDLTNPAR